jgi:Mce-associated membrane protein
MTESTTDRAASDEEVRDESPGTEGAETPETEEARHEDRTDVDLAGVLRALGRALGRTLEGRWPRTVALCLAVALLAGAGYLGWQARELRNDPVLENRAMLDEEAGSAIATAVSRGLIQVLTYDWREPEATRAAADQVLGGQAREEYDTLFDSLQDRAPGQKLTLTAQVQVAAVQRLGERDATLLVFVDQSSTRAKDDNSSVSAAQLRVEVERQDGEWVITGLQPL